MIEANNKQVPKRIIIARLYFLKEAKSSFL